MRRRPSPGSVPDGYPAEYRQTMLLPDGRRLLVRPVLPTDTTLLTETLLSTDPQALPEPSERSVAERVREVVEADYVHRFTLLAFDAGRAVGMARYARVDEGDTAILRLVVAPGWRRAGVGRELLWALATRAQECGITGFTGLARADNEAYRALLAASGGAMHGDDDVATVSMVIDWSRAPL
ncbi:MAG: GNAT family N-acetyltransferase [Jatrophihabitans sp.]|uniref:GNAT family N-acetyltransferase n=1 Tax=Jatrophihabitans sp. TaxID=1932789 RepID=UPI003F7FA837